VRALLAVVVVLAAGCGLPEDAAPRPIESIPAELTETPTSESPVVGLGRASLELYFYEDVQNQLVVVERQTETEPTIQDVLNSLAVPPTTEEIEEEIEEAQRSISSKLPEGLNPRKRELHEDGSLVVEVEGTELRQWVQEDTLRVSRVYTQMVCTMVGFDEAITSVQIVDAEGTMIPVAGQEVVIDSRPVTIDDLGGCITQEELDASATTSTTR
jgi:hypothetical protein